MTETSERPFDRKWLERVLRSTERSCVLVGGQALAFWSDYYGIQPLGTSPVDAFVTRDADFLGTRANVTALARATSGSVSFPPRRALTSLVGQVIVRAEGNAFLNIDVMHRLLGPRAEGVRRRAQPVRLGNVEFLVMHPIDVFHSRIENLARLKDKQNAEGIAQARLAVQVARAFILEVAYQGPAGEKQALRAIERVAAIAKGGAGRKVARRFGVDLLVALPEDAVKSRAFREIRWPKLVREISRACKVSTKS